ncbi:MAG: prolipoprotein diacylglyceryl transferase [Bacteroidia bacterium]
MYPDIQIGNYIITWYSFILYITLGICLLFYFFRIKRYASELSLSKVKIILFPILVIFFGTIGTRIFNVIEHLIISNYSHTSDEIISLLLDKGGGQFYGALLLVLILTPMFLIFYPYKKWLLLWDIAAPVWCLGYALGRIGCHISGHGCYGTWTNLPWGMYFPYGKAPNLLPVHPTSMYESLIHFIFLILVIKIDYRKKYNGQTILFFIFITSVSRFIIEFIRINPDMLWILSQAQLISLFLIIGSGFFYYKLNPRYHSQISTFSINSLS